MRMSRPLVVFAVAVSLGCLAVAQQAAEEYEKLGAFEAVRWKGDDAAWPEVDLGGIKYELKEIQDLPVEKVLEFCKKKDANEWRKVFEEDLVEVLSKMGKAPATGTVKVKMKPVEGGEDRTFEGVWLTQVNLEQTIKNRQVIAPAGPGAPPGAGGGAAAVVVGPVNRIEREHVNQVAEPFKFLADRIQPQSARGKDVLGRKQAEEDLDQLEWLLVNRYAYLARGNVDYKAALDTVRAGLGGEGIPRGAFAVQIHQLLALFGDGHTGASIDLEGDLPAGYLPFLLAEIAGGKVVAYDPGGAGLVDLDRPVVTSLDGVEIEKWLDAARRIAPGGSPHAVRRHCVESGLRYVNFLRDGLKLPRKAEIVVGLASLDGKNTGPLEMKLAEEPVSPPRPREGLRRTLEGNVGYLRIATMTDDPNFVRALHDAMAESRGTTGLVIDVRRNGGGSRAVLRELYPYFTDPDEARPRVVNVAAYRLNKEKNEPPDARDGYLQDRFLWPITAGVWTDEEREAIGRLAKEFRPEWDLPPLQFSAWHAMVLSPRKGAPYYHYDKPVVVLMDGGCFSATDIFLGALKGTKKVTLLGTASGGGSGRPEGFRLAHSGVGGRLSTMASFRPDGTLYDGKGVAPDVEAWPEPNDFIGRTDSVLEAALKRLK